MGQSRTEAAALRRIVVEEPSGSTVIEAVSDTRFAAEALTRIDLEA